MYFQTYQVNNQFVLDIMYRISNFVEFRQYVDWCTETFDKDEWDYSRPDVITLRITFNREEHRSFFLLKWALNE